jgi:hypothetical protein
MIRHGKYQLLTYDEQGVLLISSTIYLEGDVMTEVNKLDGSLPIEDNPEKLKEHLQQLNAKVSSMRVLGVHLQTLIIGASTLPAWLYSWDSILKQAIALGTGLLVSITFRKTITTYLLRIFNHIIGPLVKRFK